MHFVHRTAEEYPMHRTTTLAAVVAAGAVAASPAAARPLDAPVDRADRFQLETPLPKHAPQGHSRDALWRTVLPGPPTWAVDPEPLGRPAEPVATKDDDGGGWLLAGLGLTGAAIAAGGAGGLARRYRVRARRLAV
jgi:hypothetical protein